MNGKLVSEDVKEQTRQAIKNIISILEEQGTSLIKVIDVCAFLTNQDDYPSFNEVYIEFFKDPFPTRTAVTVKSLPLGAKVELKVIAQIR